jgi:rare lipoprotein A
MIGKPVSNITIEIVANNVMRSATSVNTAAPITSVSQPITKSYSNLSNSKPITLALSKEKLETVFQPVNTYSSIGQTVYPKGFGIQIGSFYDVKVALSKAKELEKLQLKNVYIQAGWAKKQKIFRVLFGNFLEKEDALFMEKMLKSEFKGIFVKQHLLLK